MLKNCILTMPRAEDPCPEGFFALELYLKK